MILSAPVSFEKNCTAWTIYDVIGGWTKSHKIIWRGKGEWNPPVNCYVIQPSSNNNFIHFRQQQSNCIKRKRLSKNKTRGIIINVRARGGVEDTRLEAKAKAKDTKKSEAKAKAKDSLSEDRHSRGQGQECSRPRPRTKDTKRKCSPKKKKKRSSQKFFRRSPKKKRSSQKFFKRSPRKNAFQKIFQPLHKILTFQKIVLSSSRGQANFRGLEASRPRPRTWPSRPRPRTSKSVLEDVLEAKDVLEDSTSGTSNTLFTNYSSRVRLQFSQYSSWQTETVQIYKRLNSIIGRLQAYLHNSKNISGNKSLNCWDLCSYETLIGIHKMGHV